MRCNTLAVAAYELRKFWRMFVVFLLVSMLLCSVTMSVLQLAMQLPDRISDMYQSKLSTTIDVSGIYADELDQIIQQDMKLTAIQNEAELGSIILGEDVMQYSEEAEQPIYGGLVWAAKGDLTVSAELMNQVITAGSGFHPSNAADPAKIWLSERTALILNVRAGDSVSLCCTDGTLAFDALLCGIYSSESYLSDYYIAPALYQELLPADVAATYSISGIPHRYEDYLRIIHTMQKARFAVSCMEFETLKSYTAFLYMLYGFCVVLLVCIISVCMHMLKLYFERRRSFFGIQRALGMQSSSVFGVALWVSEGVMLLAFLGSMLLTPWILEYVIHYINALFEGIALRRQLYGRSALLCLCLCLLLPLFSCLIEYRAIKRMNTVSILRRE